MRDVLALQDIEAPVGVLHPHLETAIRHCLELRIPAQRCRDFALEHYTWKRATDQFLDIHAALCDPASS
jgi:hypothetical protein